MADPCWLFIGLNIFTLVLLWWAEFAYCCARAEATRLQKLLAESGAPNGWTFFPPLNQTENPTLIWRKQDG